jgi:hypothetical protein
MLVVIYPVEDQDPPYEAGQNGLLCSAGGTVEPGNTVTTTLYIYQGMPTPGFFLVNEDEDDTTTTGSWATAHGLIWAGYYRLEADDSGTGIDPDVAVQFDVNP